MKSINLMLLAFVLLLVAGLAYSSVSLHPVFAEPPDPCFGDGCEGTWCNTDSTGNIDCCWDGPNGFPICQTCYTLDNGSINGCDPPRTKGHPDSSTVIPPPLGLAPPPSTENVLITQQWILKVIAHQ